MLPITQAVWRHLLHHARGGRRAWSSLRALAGELELGVSTVHKSLAHPVEIGAVSVSRLGGVELLDPLRLLMLFAAARRLQRDVVTRRRAVPMPAPWLERIALESGMILGGCGAIAAHLGGNPVTSYSTVVVYGDPDFGLELRPAHAGQEPIELLILEPDRRLARYGEVVPFAQAYADVFCLPGWQAARFIEELDLWTVVSTGERTIVA
ncbi:MAG: hypothetical protein M0T77_02645 [Actinomycetota bacterium]|nr:hypothetical protein [Actinomycetota bacterium]